MRSIGRHEVGPHLIQSRALSTGPAFAPSEYRTWCDTLAFSGRIDQANRSRPRRSAGRSGRYLERSIGALQNLAARSRSDTITSTVNIARTPNGCERGTGGSKRRHHRLSTPVLRSLHRAGFAKLPADQPGALRLSWAPGGKTWLEPRLVC